MSKLSKIFIRRKSIDWSERGVNSWVADIASTCKSASNIRPKSFNQLIELYSEPGRIYFSLAARSRAASCTPDQRSEIDNQLFHARTLIENSMIKAISPNMDSFHDLIFKRGFFGYSIKQGVTVRFPLFTCKPTEKCGGGCYAHDGRDKHLSSITRGVFNFLAVRHLKTNTLSNVSASNLLAFNNQIDKAINFAKIDARNAESSGFSRRPRIRLSHVGEMAAIPEFTNWLAQQIFDRSSGEVDSIIYTRHPNAYRLDTKSIVVNFTVESDVDERIKFAPEGAHLVASSWGGHAYESVSVNFLEHHGKKSFQMTGNGPTCPVTVNHELTPTCDTARCTLCFTSNRSHTNSD